jgi:hypothetical protein
MASAPYLSVIGWLRNDDYLDGYVARIRRAIHFLANQLNRHKVPSEIVLVEWNPPADRPLMADLLGGLDQPGFVTLRFVLVDGRYHRPLVGSKLKGMHSLNAANVGLRRARGQFLVPKAIDTFLTESVIEQIATAKLAHQEVYRCDRYDVQLNSEDWIELGDAELLNRMAQNIRHHHKRLVQSSHWDIRDLHTNACGDFTLMAASQWHEIRGFQDDPTVLCLDGDSIALHAAAAHGVREVCWPDECRVYKLLHDNIFAQRVSEKWQDWQSKLEEFIANRYSTRVMIRARMMFNYPRRLVRGIDGISGPSIERNFVKKARRYARNNTSLVTNRRDWGLAHTALVERTVTRATWDTPADK